MIDVAYALAGALAGFVVGLTGVGGGALMTPILLIFFGVSPTTAIATDLWFAAITKLVGARVHHTNGNVDWQVAKRLWLGSLPMALLIVVIVSLGAQVAKVSQHARCSDKGPGAMALAEHAHSAVPMGALARNLFNLHASQGRESKDFSSILELYLDKSQDKSGAM